jgi:hypothetical protein
MVMAANSTMTEQERQAKAQRDAIEKADLDLWIESYNEESPHPQMIAA